MEKYRCKNGGYELPLVLKVELEQLGRGPVSPTPKA
ncbi:hypothetical protein A1F99_118860 [Pyrenophora tritici-repentis]|nr:hypothetical protein A1F99_118860 [Pyrenophora tritici-repentis]